MLKNIKIRDYEKTLRITKVVNRVAFWTLTLVDIALIAFLAHKVAEALK